MSFLVVCIFHSTDLHHHHHSHPPQVVCCASSVHQNQVNTIQKLTEDYNELKKQMDGGNFHTEESRKRKEMEPPSAAVVPGVWEQLEGLCRSSY